MHDPTAISVGTGCNQCVLGIALGGDDLKRNVEVARQEMGLQKFFPVHTNVSSDYKDVPLLTFKESSHGFCA